MMEQGTMHHLSTSRPSNPGDPTVTKQKGSTVGGELTIILLFGKFYNQTCNNC